jgi:diguanylate cyclase (GGDEF)-like protein
MVRRSVVMVLLLAAMLLTEAHAAQTAPQQAAAKRARALMDQGQALEDQGRLDDAARQYTAARVEAERGGAREALADALLHVGYVRYYRGDTNAALLDLRRAYDVSVSAGYTHGQQAALDEIAHVYADDRVGQYDRAIEYYRQLLPQYEASGAAEDATDTLFNLGSTYERKGDLAAALEWFRRALAAEEKLGRPGEAAYVKRSIGKTLSQLGRAREALPLFDSALAEFVATGDADRAAQVRQSRGIVYRKLNRLDAAIADLESSRAYFSARKNLRFLEKSEDELALAYSAAGRWKEAFQARTADARLQQELAEKLREEHTTRLRLQFDSEKKDQENRALLRENAAMARIRKLQTTRLILAAVTMAILIYLAVRSVRDTRRMRVMAMTDELTRLPNRRHLFAVADEELQRTRAGGEAFSLVAFDIDHFKRINDTWGHAAGDVVLQRIANACRTALRPGDRIGRTGGEEFTLVLPSTRSRDAILVAERLREAVEAIDCTDIDPALRVTISLGVAEWTEADATLARITARADEMLYRAKNRGRNRVELATV